ncbi:hypothetical protein ACWEKT_00535 [Nocardia takedensis]
MTGQRANRTSRPRRGAAVAFCTASFAVAALLHPAPAAATATRIGVYPDINYGPLTNYGTGCAYTVEARLTSAVGPVSFYDNGVLFTTVPPTGGVAIVPWSPAYRGPHTLAASQSPEDGILATVTVEVGVGLPIGTSCLVL